MCSIGSPLMMVAFLAFAIFLVFSSSVVQSENPPLPPSKSHPSQPPPPLNQAKGHHQAPHPQPAKKGSERPRPPPDEKGAKLTPAKSKGLNAGKIVGLVFSGIVMILQIGVVGYLIYKRNRLYHAPR